MAFQRKKRHIAGFVPGSPRGDDHPLAFDREIELSRLVGLWPGELRDTSVEAAAKVIGLLRKAIRAERRRGQSGHWTYDLTRHLALSEALKAEEARLEGLRRQETALRFQQQMTSKDISTGVFASASGSAKLIGDADG